MFSRLLQVLIFFCSLTVTVGAQSANGNRQREEVRAHYEAAQSWERAGDWAAAEREWQTVIKLAPLDARALVNLGVALNRQDKSREAIAVWTRAALLDSKLTGAHFNLGLALVRSQQYAAAIPPLRRALALETGHEGARRALAV